jgi:hypothetical protein
MQDTAVNPTKLIALRGEFLPSKTDPKVFAAKIGTGMRDGVRAVIEACILLAEGDRLFANQEQNDEFRRALVDWKVLPSRSSRLGRVENSKFSMLKKIGDNAHILLDERIFGHLDAYYSVLYHVLRYYDVLLGDHETRMAAMVRCFMPQGSLSRDFLIEQISSKKIPDNDNAEVGSPLHAIIKAETTYDLVVMTPLVDAHLQRVAEGSVGPLPLWSRTHQRMAKDAVCLVFAKARDLPLIGHRLLPGCGFGAISQILLPHRPNSPNVTDANVIAIARRGQGTATCDADFHWISEAALDVEILAERLAPESKQKLHLFAASESEGWRCVVGEANWSDADV